MIESYRKRRTRKSNERFLVLFPLGKDAWSPVKISWSVLRNLKILVWKLVVIIVLVNANVWLAFMKAVHFFVTCDWSLAFFNEWTLISKGALKMSESSLKNENVRIWFVCPTGQSVNVRKCVWKCPAECRKMSEIVKCVWKCPSEHNEFHAIRVAWVNIVPTELF